MARLRAGSLSGALTGALCIWWVGCSLEPVRLGVVLPMSGPYATYGASLERGARVAVDQVNREGGVQGRRLEVLVRDSGSRPEQAAMEFQELIIKEKVPAVVGGGTSAEALAMAATAERERRVLLSPSASSPELTPVGEWVFRNWPSDEIEARTMADFAAFTLHVTRIAIVEEQSAYARGIAGAFVTHFEKAGRSDERIGLPMKGADFPETVKRVQALRPEVQAVYLVGYGEKVVPLQHALRASGLNVPVLSVSALSDGDILKRSASELEGIVFARPSFDLDNDSPVSQEFLVAYQSRYGGEPDIYAAHAYDSVRLLAEAMAMEGIGPEEIKRGLLKIKNFPGASGSITFDSHGDIVQTFELCVIKGGKAIPLARAGNDILTALQKRVDILRFGG